MDESKFLKVAKQAALEAGKVISKYYGRANKLAVKDNDSTNFVTQADLESEKVIIKIINSSFPNHNIVSEEIGMTNKGSKYTWVIDPLDGTVAFAASLPLFSISIALLKEKNLILGIVNQVPTKELYWAQRARGAFLNGKKISVSRESKLGEAMFGVDFGHRLTRQHKYNVYIKHLATKVGYVYALSSVAAMFGMIARGSLDGFASDAWHWDLAAGAIIIEEAGGKVTNPEGKPINWTKDRLSIVASNGLIHNRILEALRG